MSLVTSAFWNVTIFRHVESEADMYQCVAYLLWFLRLLLCQAQESALTGESVPVLKDILAVGIAAPLGDRKCLLFAGVFF